MENTWKKSVNSELNLGSKYISNLSFCARQVLFRQNNATNLVFILGCNTFLRSRLSAMRRNQTVDYMFLHPKWLWYWSFVYRMITWCRRKWRVSWTLRELSTVGTYHLVTSVSSKSNVTEERIGYLRLERIVTQSRVDLHIRFDNPTVRHPRFWITSGVWPWNETF